MYEVYERVDRNSMVLAGICTTKEGALRVANIVVWNNSTAFIKDALWSPGCIVADRNGEVYTNGFLGDDMPEDAAWFLKNLRETE